MKKNDVEVGKVYAVKVSNKIQPVQLVRSHHLSGWEGLNLNTNRSVRILTAAKLRYEMHKTKERWVQGPYPIPMDLAKRLVEVRDNIFAEDKLKRIYTKHYGEEFVHTAEQLAHKIMYPADAII